jgi:hypothetical protein
MKKLLLALALVSIGFTNAQIKKKGTIEITPKIGYTTFAEVGDEGSTNSNSGIAPAATIDFYFNNRWSLRSGLIFNKMGGKYSFNNKSYEDQLNYLNVPINANWHFGSTRKWNLNFGLSPSFLTKANVIVGGKSSSFGDEVIKSFQLGLTYGIGYKIEITKKFGILLDAQWFNGLTNISNTGVNFTNSGSSYNVGGVIEL